MKLAALMTVYNEAKFLSASISSILGNADWIICVEGAYQETIQLGKPARSDDDTIPILWYYDAAIKAAALPQDTCVEIIEANEKSDAQQRNVGLNVAKELGMDWLLIVDGDEVYKPFMFKMIQRAMQSDFDAFVFSCYTFVNDFEHYTIQKFPRLFRLYPDTEFTNDNFVRSNGKEWNDLKIGFLDIKYYHYAFLKGLDRFQTKKDWWESRFDQPFHYDWEIKDGQIIPDNHEIYEYNGSHPKEIIDKFKV